MAAIRRVLKHVSVEIAAGTRKCHHKTTHAIRRGEPCLIIRDDGGQGKKNYCLPCASDILDRAKSDLTKLGSGLTSPAAGDAGPPGTEPPA